MALRKGLSDCCCWDGCCKEGLLGLGAGSDGAPFTFTLTFGKMETELTNGCALGAEFGALEQLVVPQGAFIIGLVILATGCWKLELDPCCCRS